MTGSAVDAELPWPDDAVEVGCIVDAWGIKGGFKVKPFSSDPQALFSSRRWFLKPADDTARRPVVPAATGQAKSQAKPSVLPQVLKITQAREQGEWVVATAHDVPDRNAAEALRGARVYVSRQSFPSADPDEFYWVDLIGLSVRNRDGDALGVVTDLLDTGPHCVLRVRRPEATADMKPDEAERLIPFVAAFVDQVDLPGRLITVDWGLDF